MKFDGLRFAKEVVWVVLAGLAGLAATVSTNPKVLEDLGAGNVTTPVLLMIGYGIVRAAIGWGKTHWPEDSILRKVLMLAVCAGLVFGVAGCKTTNRQIVTQETHDPQTGEVYRDRMEQVNTAGPFGKADALQDARWQYGEGEYVSLGSTASADNTAQVQAVQAASDIAAKVIGQVLAQIVPAIAAPGATESPQSSATPLGRLNNALEQINALRAQVDALRGLYGDVLPNRDEAAIAPVE